MTTEIITEPNIQAGVTLHSSSASYSILELIGEGCFGKVAKCKNLQNGETVAVKVLKKDPDFIQDAEHEVSILKTLSVLDPDSINIVKFYEQFDFMDRTCLAFEMLEANLYDLIDHNDGDPMHLQKLRPIAKQLLVALAALKNLGIVHTDIKPDNIMVVREQEESFRVKLIDFGLAIPAHTVQLGTMVQPIGYRAPEVSLGLPYDEAIDIWGVGCVLGYLFLAHNLFPIFCDYRMIKRIVEILGLPPDRMLWNGGYTEQYFVLEETGYCHIWRLQTPEEFALKNGDREKEPDSSFLLPDSLNDMLDIYPEILDGEAEDTKAFVQLMKGLLHLDVSQRLTPQQALQQPFITMTHLSQDEEFSDYLSTSQLRMRNCPESGKVTAPQQRADSWRSVSNGEATGYTCEEGLPSLSQWAHSTGHQEGQLPAGQACNCDDCQSVQWDDNSWNQEGQLPEGQACNCDDCQSVQWDDNSWNQDELPSDQSLDYDASQSSQGVDSLNQDAEIPDEQSCNCSVCQSSQWVDDPWNQGEQVLEEKYYAWQSDESCPETPDSWSLDEDGVGKAEEVAPTDPPAAPETSLMEPPAATMETLLADPPAAPGTSLMESPVATNTLLADSPPALETSMPDSPPATNTLLADSPPALETSMPDSPPATNTLLADSPPALETSLPDSPPALETSLADSPAAMETLLADSPAATNASLADSPAATQTSPGGLGKRIRRFFKGVKRQVLLCCCCCLSPAEE